MENISRRNFMKGVGAVALATAATGLLSGCGDSMVIEDASGLNDTANMNGIKMTVREVLYGTDLSSGTVYVIPKVVIQNSTAAGIPVDPTGSFRIIVNGTDEMVLNESTMAEMKTLSAVSNKTLSRGMSETGYLCSKATNVGTPKYVYVMFYPNPADTKTALRCKIMKNQWGIIGSL